MSVSGSWFTSSNWMKLGLIGDQTRPLLAEAMVSEGLSGQMRMGDGRGEGERNVVRGSRPISLDKTTQ